MDTECMKSVVNNIFKFIYRSIYAQTNKLCV